MGLNFFSTILIARARLTLLRPGCCCAPPGPSLCFGFIARAARLNRWREFLLRLRRSCCRGVLPDGALRYHQRYFVRYGWSPYQLHRVGGAVLAAVGGDVRNSGCGPFSGAAWETRHRDRDDVATRYRPAGGAAGD